MNSNNKIIGIASKPSHSLTSTLTPKVFEWITKRGFDYRIDQATADALTAVTFDRAKIVARETLTTSCALVVVLGGDGTLISVSRHPTTNSSVVLGVNLGTLGFLTEVTTAEIFTVLESAIAGTADIKTRPLLKAELVRAGKNIAEYHAINDVVITKEALARIFSVKVFVNKDYAATLRGDGVIVATPGGSTAYNLAAGGSIVYPTVDAQLITPICSHSLSSRPLVIPGSALITLEVITQMKIENEHVFLTIDGQEGAPLQAGDTVVVSRSPFTASFVKSPSKNFFDILRTKLNWIYPT